MHVIRWIAIVLLVLLGIGAVVGSVPMLADPHGAPLGMSQAMLAHSPFHSYFIPGLALLLANGGLAFWAAYMALRRAHDYGFWIAAQGVVLVGWVVFQCIFLHFIAWPHYLHCYWGLMLVACGVALHNDGAQQS
jgi:hypothetical protein